MPGLVTIAWAVMVIFAYHYSQRTGVRIPLCTFRTITGVPCATCGGTHAAMALASGHPKDALDWNPLVTLLLAAAPAWVGWRFWRGPTPPWSTRRRRVVLALSALALALNWAYVIRHERQVAAASPAAQSPR